jgi:arabinofuranosyltransferase
LMTLLMSFATSILDKSTAVLSIQILGVAFMLAIAYATMKISDSILQNSDHSQQALVRILAFFWCLFYYPLAYWSLMGMETGLLTLLLLLGVLSSFHYVKTQNITLLFLTSVFLGLAFLTRNDSIFAAILVWAYLAWETYSPRSKANLRGLTRLFGAMSMFFIFVVGQLVFQKSYYGTFMPNTYTLKLTGMPLLVRVINGIEFVTPFLVASAAILILASLEVISNFQRQKLLLLSIVFSVIGYQIYVGGDAWNYWRMIIPAMPFLIVLFIVTINALVTAASATQAFRVYFFRNPMFSQKNLIQILAIFLTVMGLLSANTPFLREIAFINQPYTSFDNQVNVNIAIVLNELTTPEAIIGVFWAGTVPYFSDRKAIDFFGKTDRYIAQLPPDLSGKVSWLGMSSRPGHNKYDLDYSIKTLKPTYVQGFQWGRQDLSQYSKVKYVQVEYDGITLFFHKDSPHVLWSKLNIP